MNDRLDHLMERLGASAADRSLEGLDGEVNRGIARLRLQARTASALVPVSVASIGLALALGLTAGGLTATMSHPTTHTPGAFSMAADLAPSTLLEGRQ